MNLVQHFTGGEEVSIRHWAANLSVGRICLLYNGFTLVENHKKATNWQRTAMKELIKRCLKYGEARA